MIDTTPEKWQWDSGHQEVRFCAWQNGILVMCRISREAIEDRCPHPPTPGACVEAAREHVTDVVARLSDLLAQGRFENDGSLLLRSSDW